MPMLLKFEPKEPKFDCKYLLVEAETKERYRAPIFAFDPVIDHLSRDHVFRTSDDGKYLVWIIFRYSEIPEYESVAEVFGSFEQAELTLTLKGVSMKEGLPPYFGRSPDGHWIDVTWAWTKGVAENAERRNVDSSKTRFQDFHTHKIKIVNPRDKLRKAIEDGRFIKNRVCFGVAKYALADVMEALARDQDHNVQIVVTKEDGDLVVMFERRPKPRIDGHADGGPEETGPIIR